MCFLSLHRYLRTYCVHSVVFHRNATLYIALGRQERQNIYINDKIRQMAATNHVKNLARQLYQEGHETAFISQRCDVSLRTVQRWVKSFEKEKVTVTSQAEAPDTEVLPALERIANTSSDSVSVSIIPSTAVRLLNLAQASIAAVEGVLYNPDSSDANKIRAAALASKWVGLEASNGKNANPSVFGTIAKKTGVSIKVESSEDSEIRLTPLMVESKREQEEVKRIRKAEAEARRQEEFRKLKEAEEERKLEEMDEAMGDIVDELSQLEAPYPYEKIIEHPLFNLDMFVENLSRKFENDIIHKIVEEIAELLELSTEELDLIKEEHSYYGFPKRPYLMEEWEYGEP